MDVSFTLPSCPSGDGNNNVDDGGGGDGGNGERVMHVRLQLNFFLQIIRAPILLSLLI